MNLRYQLPVVHFSDWHGQWRKLPWAKLYICTGDMLENHCTFEHEIIDGSLWWRRITDPDKEARLQKTWLRTQVRRGNPVKGLRRLLGNPDAPVVICRGNHDFTDLSSGFGGEVYEPKGVDPETFVIPYAFENGRYNVEVKVGVMRGVTKMVGEWSDELDQPELDEVCRKLPTDLDILVTHAPSSGLLDEGHIGVRGLAAYLNKRLSENTGRRLLLHAHGHAHGDGGKVMELGDKTQETIVSNAATKFNMFNLGINV